MLFPANQARETGTIEGRKLFPPLAPSIHESPT